MNVHLGIILISNQLDAQFLLYIFLFQFSTCSEQLCAHHQESQLYQYIWYTSRCVGGLPVCRSVPTCIPDGRLHRVTYTRCCIDSIDSPDDEHWATRNMDRSEINTLKKYVKLVFNTNSPRYSPVNSTVRTYFAPAHYSRPAKFRIPRTSRTGTQTPTRRIYTYTSL